MIQINDKKVELNHFLDGTLLVKEAVTGHKATITWLFESNEELVALYFLTNHMRTQGITDITLKLPYIPNARQDRVKREEDIFTLKYFAQMINDLNFTSVTVLDPHSYVSEALLDRIKVQSIKPYVERVLAKLQENKEENAEKKVANAADTMLFFPDEGAMKRYSAMFALPYAFGIKKRDWVSGEIKGLEVSGQTERIQGATVLIVDDICSRGGTFYFSAKKLRELGAAQVYLYISHCENTILEGDLLESGYVDRVFTTKSIFTGKHEKVEVFDYE